MPDRADEIHTPLPKTYIGDSVYVDHGSFIGEIVLTTENGMPSDPSNRIVLEPHTLNSLLEWLKRQGMVRLK